MSGSLHLFDEFKERAVSEIGNQFIGSLALLRGRVLRILNALPSSNPKEQTRILTDILLTYGYLMRVIALAQRIQRETRMIYPTFKPETHYAKIQLDNEGKELSRVVVALEDIPIELHDARHKWFLAELAISDCTDLQETLNIWFDAYYGPSGAAIIQKFLRPSDTRTNFAIEESEADIIRDVWGMARQPTTENNGKNGETKKEAKA
jgi:hypothetical protein